jgi:hypothetical protein
VFSLSESLSCGGLSTSTTCDGCRCDDGCRWLVVGHRDSHGGVGGGSSLSSTLYVVYL